MHEFTMCESLLQTVSAEYARFVAGRPRESLPRVTRVRLVLGDLHQIVTESFQVAWEALTADTPFAGATLVMQRVPLAVRCRSCAWEGEIEAPFFLCGRCGQGDVETTSGREFYIEDMEIEDNESEGV
jgi:hydrogenase nickel incorporation protein HypA/HybF